MKTNLKEVKKFGFILTAFLLIVGTVSYFKGHETRAFVLWGIDAVVLLLNVFYLPAMKPIYVAAMKMAGVLGYINTKIILSVVYYLIFTPIGIFLKIMGKDLLDEKIDTNQVSYWIDKEIVRTKPEDYERLF